MATPGPDGYRRTAWRINQTSSRLASSDISVTSFLSDKPARVPFARKAATTDDAAIYCLHYKTLRRRFWAGSRVSLRLAGFFAIARLAVRDWGWGEKQDAAASEGHPTSGLQSPP